MDDTNPLDAAADAAREALMSAPGGTQLSLRRAVERRVRGGDGDELEPLVLRLVDQVTNEPGSADVQALLEAGWTEDQLLELMLVAASTAGVVRLERGRASMEKP